MSKADRTTKVLLAIIAVGIWALIFRPMVAARLKREGRIIVPSGGLTFVTPNGTPVAKLWATKGMSRFALLGPKGRSVVSLDSLTAAGGMISVAPVTGKTRILMGCGPGRASLVVVNPTGNPAIFMNATQIQNAITLLSVDRGNEMVNISTVGMRGTEFPEAGHIGAYAYQGSQKVPLWTVASEVLRGR